jgi:hypothetical protein
VAGKYHLHSLTLPVNPNTKELTYHLFHHFGGAFSCLFTEIPQPISVTHDSVLAAGQNYFTVSADSAACISLTSRGNILGVETANGNPTNISIPPQAIGDTLRVTVTKVNHLRYSKTVPVVDPASPVTSEKSLLSDFRLFQNYPNPFNPSTVISWFIPNPAQGGDGQLAVGSNVTLEIYNLRGQKVKTLLSASLLPGLHSLEFDASDLSSGIYLYRLLAGSFLETKKMVVLK